MKSENNVLDIYKNYGCLGAEKRVVYTCGAKQATAVCSDIIKVEIPEDWKIFENSYGELMVTAPWGWDYSINEVLGGNEIPCFSALSKDGENYIKRLKIIE